MNKIAKALNFVSNARSDSFLPDKIASYISVLESLLSSEKTELRYQVSERAATILGESKEEKVEIFSTIRKAYDIRSSYVHGSNITKGSVESTSNKVDDIIRRLIKKNHL